MKQLGCWFSCAILLILAGNVQAGCGILRRGGCSDPCSAASCGGLFHHHRASCSNCGAGGFVSSQQTTVSGYDAPSQIGYSYAQGVVGATVYSGGSTGCSVCGGQAVTQGASYAAPMYGYPSSGAVYSSGAISAAQVQREDLVDCGPVASYKVVMEPEYVTETRAVPQTTYQDEVRYRTRTITRQVPVEVQDYRSKTVMVPKTETKTVQYSVLVPQKGEKQVEVVDTVPVWNEVTENYTVRVPTVVDVPEQYTVRVPKLRTEEFSYTVQVPQAQTETRIQTVTNAVPVTKTRVVQINRPVTRMQTVTRDYGHWEVRVEEVASMSTAPVAYAAPVSGGAISFGGCGTSASYSVSSGTCGSCGGCGQVYSSCSSGISARRCGSCGGCGSISRRMSCGGCGSSVCGGGCGQSVAYGSGASCGTMTIGGVSEMAYAPATVSVPTTQTVSRRVWVPNVVTEEVPVVENVAESQEIAYTAFEQQTTEVPYECTQIVYVPEQRTGTRQVVDYVEEARTRNRKVVQYNDETRTRVRKELSYKQETRTQTVPYVTYTTEQRTKEVSFTVNVPETQVEPFTTTRYETVQEEVSEEYTVRVPVSTMQEVQVQVARMVPKLVPITINPCQTAVTTTSGQVFGGPSYPAVMGSGAGCTNCGTPTLAPMVVPGCSTCQPGLPCNCQ